ncbi:hypothetical protein P5641_00075 (plasmid) [Bacillus subtilis]|nr:hypothetical protein P5641_00075 [Bacillus subtilis]
MKLETKSQSLLKFDPTDLIIEFPDEIYRLMYMKPQRNLLKVKEIPREEGYIIYPSESSPVHPYNSCRYTIETQADNVTFYRVNNERKARKLTRYISIDHITFMHNDDEVGFRFVVDIYSRNGKHDYRYMIHDSLPKLSTINSSNQEHLKQLKDYLKIDYSQAYRFFYSTWAYARNIMRTICKPEHIKRYEEFNNVSLNEEYEMLTNSLNIVVNPKEDSE